jgi:hypothetical protein
MSGPGNCETVEQRTDRLTAYYTTLVTRHSVEKVVRHLVAMIVKRQKDSDFAGMEAGQ